MTPNTTAMALPTLVFVRFLVLTVLGYAAVGLLCEFAIKDPKLVVVVSAFKAVSLVALILVSEGIGRDIDRKSDRMVWYCNRAISLVSVFLVVLLAFKILNVKALEESLSPWALRTLTWLQGWVSLLSLLPLLAYAALNLWAGYLRNAPATSLQHYARCYFVLADCTCVIPLLFLALLRLVHHSGDSEEFEVFFSGAVAVIIFVSNMVSKAVEVFIDDKMAEVLGERLRIR